MRKAMITAPLLALVLTGCVSLGPKAPPTLLNLTAENVAAAGTGSSGTYANAVVVLEPAAEQRLNVNRVPVQIDDANVAYLKDAMWVERPARLFQHLIAETIRAHGSRLVVESDPGVSGVKLSGRLLDMGYDVRTSSAMVRFDAVKELPGGKVEARRFEHVVPGIAAKPGPIGNALNEAANAVAREVADWVG